MYINRLIFLLLLLICNVEYSSNTATIEPDSDYNAANDAYTIYASKNDAQTIGKIFVRRSASQRSSINESYQNLAKTPIIGDYKGTFDPSVSNTYFDILDCLCQNSLPDIYVLFMDTSSFGHRFTTWHMVLSEVLIIADENRYKVVQQFNAKFSESSDSLENAINGFEPEYKLFMQKLTSRARLTSDSFDFTKYDINLDAQALLTEKSQWYHTRDTLSEILMTKPINYVQKVLAAFLTINNNESLQSAIQEVITDWNVMWGFTALVDYIEDKYAFMAKRIKENLTEEDNYATIVFIITARAEIDLVEIRTKYEEIYKSKMDQDICAEMGKQKIAECSLLSILINGGEIDTSSASDEGWISFF